MAEMTNAERNKALIEAFASQFNPESVKGFAGSPNVHPTDGIADKRVPDAYTMSIFDQCSGIGVTAIVFGRQFFKAYLEIVVSPNDGIECMAGAADTFRPIMAGMHFAFALARFGESLRGEAPPVDKEEE
jgi:hypothetical protein